jgi:hypothetical protein
MVVRWLLDTYLAEFTIGRPRERITWHLLSR